MYRHVGLGTLLDKGLAGPAGLLKRVNVGAGVCTCPMCRPWGLIGVAGAVGSPAWYQAEPHCRAIRGGVTEFRLWDLSLACQFIRSVALGSVRKWVQGQAAEGCSCGEFEVSEIWMRLCCHTEHVMLDL